MVIRKLKDLIEYIRDKKPLTFVVVSANDINTLSAITKAVGENLINVVLIGNEALIRPYFKEHPSIISGVKIINQPDDEKAAALAIEMIKSGEGDVLMKGLISTDKFMKAILNKEKGLVEPGGLLSHVAVIENKNYHKLIVAGDVAVIPNPDLRQKKIMISYLASVAVKLGIVNPKIAVIAPTEKIIASIASTTDAEILRKMNFSGEIKGCIVEGPLALDLALDKEAASIKGLDNPVAGNADCLLFPNLDAGNVFYKANTTLSDGEAAAVMLGAKIPVVLTSRGDSFLTKLYSIALAALLGLNSSYSRK
jgi:phosphate butyryltransferase